MSVPTSLQSLLGQWTGDNALWLMPSDPSRHSVTVAEVAVEAKGQFLTIRYRWADGDVPQEGLLMLAEHPKTSAVVGVFTDSWHLAHDVMLCRGAVDETGVVSLLGAYAAPPGPDWGWRVTVAPPTDDRFTLRMYNVTPDGDEALAVEANYIRVA